MPRWFTSIALVLTLLMLVPILLLVKARVTNSPLPRYMIVFDMDNQDKVKTQHAFDLFADGRGMRTPPEGVVARDEIVGDPHLSDGRIGDAWATTFPVPVDDALLRRGRERYGVFCAPCHGHSGEGDGMVALRANELMEGTWVSPSNLHDAAVVERPVGHLYNTIRRGVRKMPPYGSQVPVLDRWAIVSYVRALQLSRGAGAPSDLSADDRALLAAD